MVEYNKRDLFAAGTAVFIILILFLPSVLVHFKNVKTGRDSDSRRAHNLEEHERSQTTEIPYNRWFKSAQNKLKKTLTSYPKQRTTPAKNIIFFLGDGMGISTLTSARILKWQRQEEDSRDVEEPSLEFEEWPHAALVKTYCSDHVVADSACSATAYMTGIKGRKDTLGVTEEVEYEDCEAQLEPAHHRHASLLYHAQEAGLSTGLVTTDRLTGASPAGGYAHSASRDWENNQGTPEKCPDIASQLIRNRPGNQMRVILGGGEKNFNNSGNFSDGRTDGQDLIAEWMEDKKNSRSRFIDNRVDLKSLDPDTTDFLLGIFNADEFEYKLDIGDEDEKQPRLFEMTKTAIELLRGDEEGFVLFVEAAHVDKAHHKNWAKKSLEEVMELELAVKTALNLVNISETLMIVTADHSHSLTINGYPRHEADILGYDGGRGSQQRSDDPLGRHYPSLMYSTGPGKRLSFYDISEDQRLSEADFVYPATVFRESAAHGGEDVALYAIGPYSDMFHGLMDQHQIPHILSYAGNFGEGIKCCN